MITYRKNVQDRYSRAATVASARAAVTTKPDHLELATFAALVLSVALVSVSLVWVLV